MKRIKITITAFVMAVLLLLGTVSAYGMSVSEVDPDNKYKYEEMVLSKALTEDDLKDPSFEIFHYSEGYEYYSPDNNTTGDEATPDYVVIRLSAGSIAPLPVCHICGDYVLYEEEETYPFRLGRGIYIPKTQEVYSLKDAYEMGIEDIEKVFTEAKVGRLMGDMDEDRRLSVKDATYIQKALAGFEGFTDFIIYAAEFDKTLPCSIADFNRDRSMNIKDATAIQKHLVGLEY